MTVSEFQNHPCDKTLEPRPSGRTVRHSGIPTPPPRLSHMRESLRSMRPCAGHERRATVMPPAGAAGPQAPLRYSPLVRRCERPLPQGARMPPHARSWPPAPHATATAERPQPQPQRAAARRRLDPPTRARAARSMTAKLVIPVSATPGATQRGATCLLHERGDFRGLLFIFRSASCARGARACRRGARASSRRPSAGWGTTRNTCRSPGRPAQAWRSCRRPSGQR